MNNYDFSNFSSDVQYIYNQNGQIIAKRAKSKDDLLYAERRYANIDSSYYGGTTWYNDGSNDPFVNIVNGWAIIGNESNPCEQFSIEQLSFETVQSQYLGGGIPTSEFQKWCDAHGVSVQINNDWKDEWGWNYQQVKFNYEGKDYEWNVVSYEVMNSIEFGVTGSTDIANDIELGHLEKIIHVKTAQELRSAMLNATDSSTIIILDNDIDMSGVKWEPVPEFKGILSGDDHIIKNLTIEGDGENVGFVAKLAGTIQDITFENAKVTNKQTEFNTYTGVVAGSVYGGDGMKNVCIKNSTVTGGGCAGMAAGFVGVHGRVSAKVQGCTVSGDYATGGLVGYQNGGVTNTVTGKTVNSSKVGGCVYDTVLNGGQWAGGWVGSADNLLDGYKVLTGEYDVIKNLTINGNYHDKQTLGAGGLYGRISSCDQNGFNVSVASGVHYDITTSNAYASGQLVGWACDIDPETGKVICNENVTISSNSHHSNNLVGKAGTTEADILSIYSGRIDEPLTETVSNGSTFVFGLNYLAKFAQENNLKPVPNTAGMCYEDDNGVRYFLGNYYSGIACSDYENSIDAYKRLVCSYPGTQDRPDAITLADGTTMSMYDYYKSLGCDVDKNGMPLSYNCAYWYRDDNGDLMYCFIDDPKTFQNQWELQQDGFILNSLGAVKVYYKDGSLNEASGAGKGKETFEEIYFQTADGNWHKLTRSGWGGILNAKKYLEEGVIEYCKPEDFGTFTIEDYIKAFGGTPETISLDGIPCFCIEDLTWEEIYQQTSGNLTDQPPYNTGFHDEGDDGYVVTLREETSPIDGIDLDPHPENATYQDYKDMLVLINFINGVTNGERNGDGWTTLSCGLELTEQNWQMFKDAIPLLNKEQAIQKALELFLANAGNLYGSGTGENDNPYELANWAKELLKICGAENISYTRAATSTGGFSFSPEAYATPNYVSFNIDGKQYKVAMVDSYYSGVRLPDSVVITKEQVEELKQYMSEEEYNKVINFYFTPLVEINGEAQSYMFTWTHDISVIKQEQGAQVPDYIPCNFDEVNGFELLLNYVKTHDVKSGRHDQKDGEDIPHTSPEIPGAVEALAAEKAAEAATKTETEKQTISERRDYVTSKYKELVKQLGNNNVAIDYFSQNLSTYADKYIKGKISQSEFDSAAAKVLEKAKAKITNPGKNDSINKGQKITSTHLNENNNGSSYNSPQMPEEVHSPKNEVDAKIYEDYLKAKNKDKMLKASLEKYQEPLSAYSGALDKLATLVLSVIDSFLNGEIDEDEFNKLVESMYEDVLTSVEKGVEVHEETITSDDYTKKRNVLARKLGLIEIQTDSCIYYGMNADGSKSYYIYDPEQGKFVEFERTESEVQTQEQIKRDAMLKAQKQGLSFTSNYPFVCRKGDILYRYDKSTGEFVKFYTAYKPKTDKTDE